MAKRDWMVPVAAALAAVLGTGGAQAAALEGFVRDGDGRPVADAVISAVVVSGGRATLKPARAVVDQVDREFVPHVRPIVVGSDVVFPNKDELRHHVYSFSPARKFELPLYKGTQAPPVKFDAPGVVVLGCNIHDWMIGYVYVLETPWFATTADTGRARIDKLPAGTYEIRVWHPRLPDGVAPAVQKVTIGGKDERVEFGLKLDPETRRRRAPSRSGTKYR